MTDDEDKALRELLEDADTKAGLRLTDWRDRFLCSIRTQRALRGKSMELSGPQRKALKDIEKKVYAT